MNNFKNNKPRSELSREWEHYYRELDKEWHRYYDEEYVAREARSKVERNDKRKLIKDLE